ncbi:MAG: cell division protein ZapA [Bacteroidota bacterium]
MKSIKVSILGKQYPIKVEDDEVETMERIARFVDKRFSEFKKDLKQQPDPVVMALASLSIAEELFEERDKQNKEREQVTASQLDEAYMQSIQERLQDIKDELPS